ncbi:MAG: ABC transporter substrate-binding protein [Candidatus Binatia bacterium]
MLIDGTQVADDAGRAVELVGSPQRIVSLVPSVTELICDLGCADRLVGVTRFCTEPAAVVARLPRVGGTKTPIGQRITALRPDLILVNSEENRREDFEALVATGVPVFVSFATTVAGAARSVERLGVVLGAERAALALTDRMETEHRRVLAAVRHRSRVFCPVWRRPWMSFNADTYCHDVLASAGADNVCAAAATRYPSVSLEEVARAAPEVILLPDEPYPFGERHRQTLRPLADTPACREGRVHFVDGKALSWYGARTPQALWMFAELLAARR